MPRKYFRRVVPSHDSIRENRLVARFGPWLQHPNLWHLNRRSVAGGVAAGLFTGLIPGSNPVQFTAAGLVAIAFRVNLPVAVVVTLYTNLFTIVPLLYIALHIGLFVLREDAATLPLFEFELHGRNLGQWFVDLLYWVSTVGKPLAVGLPLMGIAFAVIGYFAVDWTWRLYVRCAWRRRGERRRRAEKG